MRRKEQDIAVMHQRKRRKHKIKLGIAGTILIVLAAVLILTYFKLSKNEYNTYTEKAKVNYKVSLKENEFYQDKYVDEKSTIIASLINNIDVDFNYKMNLANEQDYTYEYKIVAKTNVRESSKSTSIYETTDELVSSIQQESNSKQLDIADSVTIDYNEYNEKINKFINLYQYVLWIGIALAVAGVIVFVMLIKYIIEKRSAETMYAQELKQILFNYKSYIQKSNTPIDTKGYKVISINTFEEILGLRDTMQLPILMYAEEEEERTKFMILTDKIMYLYILGAKEIREELRAKNAEKNNKKNK